MMPKRTASVLLSLLLAGGTALAQEVQWGWPPIEDAPPDDLLYENMPLEEPLFEDAPFEGVPFEGEPFGEMPTEGSIQEMPLEEAPTEQVVQRVENPVAEFAGIDKITGRITNFDVYIDETVQFGALQVTPRICYGSGEGQEPRTDGFIEVDEITLDRQIRRIFSGWMFAESPGLNAVEHAVYDVWLTACKTRSDVPAPEAAEAEG